MHSTYPCTRLTDPDHPSVHAYYDCCPEDPAGERIACFRFDGPVPGPGRVEIRKRDGTLLEHFADGDYGIGHVGTFPAWLDDRTLAWTDRPDTGEGTARSMLRDLDGGEEHELPGRIRQFHGPSGRGLSQETVAGDANPYGLCHAILVIDREGNELGRLDIAACIAAHPYPQRVPPAETLTLMNSKWSPDGSRFFVVFNTEVYRKRSGERDAVPPFKCLMVADRDGANARFLGDFSHHPLWTPDGTAVIAYQRQDGGQDLLRYDAETGERTVLIPDCPGVHPSLDAEQRHVITDCFDCPEPGRVQVVRIPVADPQAKEVLAEFAHRDYDHRDGHHPHPVFGRDGTRIYFNAQDGGCCGVFALDLQ